MCASQHENFGAARVMLKLRQANHASDVVVCVLVLVEMGAHAIVVVFLSRGLEHLDR